MQNGAIAYGLTCVTTLDEVKEILNRLVLGQFSPISAENILISFSKSGLTSLVLADFMETNFQTITSILSFDSLRSILHNLSLSPKSSKVKLATRKFQIDEPDLEKSLITIDFKLHSMIAENMENTTQTRLILSEMDFFRLEAIEWTEKHRLKFICNLRKYYHSKVGQDCS